MPTNGYLIDEEWAAFLSENHFLVGLSLDGPAELHNLNRQDTAGGGTFNQVMRAVRLLEKHHVAFHILCVVTGKNARPVEKIYRFYRKQEFRWLQFIPCIEPLARIVPEWYIHLPSELIPNLIETPFRPCGVPPRAGRVFFGTGRDSKTAD